MDLSTISISSRPCTEDETKALSLWSASVLPLCQTWTATRGLQPPIDVIETLQKLRFQVPSISEAMLKPIITAQLDNGQHGPSSEYDSKLEGIATNLSHDLWQLQMSVSHVNAHNHKQSFVTESRDLRRFQRAMSHLQLTRLEIATSKSIVIVLFSPERMALYIPRWLIEGMPRTMFEPNQSFYRARPASLAWLLLDAIVITATNEFKTL